MKIELFRRLPSFESLRRRMLRHIEHGIKCVLIALAPLPFVALACAVWHYGFYSRGFHFNEKMEVIVTAAWIPTFALVYGLLVNTVLTTVWNEYKEMRNAVKTCNIERFIDLKDEDVSLVVLTLVTIVSLFVLGGFMSIQYSEWLHGFTIIATTAYIFGLIFIVVKEIDDPCGGLWFIKSIPPEWLRIDAKAWRAERMRKFNEEHAETIKRFTVQVTVIETNDGPPAVEVTTTGSTR